ncbi:class I SAM-dependent methyltransferase [Alkalibacterium sp.]|nr:MAG: class I SAM-dependent methyltransferase [Alkalibacterium sp.]
MDERTSYLETTHAEKFYTVLLESAMLIRKDLDSTFLEALIESGENILDNGKINIENGLPTHSTQVKLKELYESVKLDSLSLDDKKQAVQLILIKAVKEDMLQPNHQPTPDAIGLLMSYLAELFVDFSEPAHIADLSIGTGNLLYTFYSYLSRQPGAVKHTYTGVENDELLISLTSTLSALLDIPVELLHQDALKPLLINPIDIILSDLPVGYYPVQIEEGKFSTALKDGHSYSHFLLIEQGLKYLKEAGLGFYLLPTQTFESEEVKILLSHINTVGYVQAIIHLPNEWFKNEQSRKSILVLQKKGSNSRQAQEVLVATSPSLSDKQAFQNFLMDIKTWKEEQEI